MFKHSRLYQFKCGEYTIAQGKCNRSITDFASVVPDVYLGHGISVVKNSWANINDGKFSFI